MEILGLSILVSMGCILGFSYMGGPITWDELLYMSVSQNTQGYGFILNRYFHIYLQKLFFLFSGGDPFTGARLLWCFLISTTLCCIYFLSRRLARSNGVIIGILAITLFLSQSLVFGYTGVTYADFTAMTMISLGAAVYLFHIHALSHGRMIALVFLGTILFFAVKSKETSVFLALVLIGLGRDRQDRFLIARFAKDFVCVTIGAAMGGVAFCLADKMILGDAWFWIRSSKIRELFTFNKGFVETEYQLNWVAAFFKQGLMVPIVLYVFCVWKLRTREFRFSEKALWLIPLGLFMFLVVFVNRTLSRYLIPILPIFCVWAALAIDRQVTAPPKRSRSFPLNAFSAFVLAGLAVRVSPGFPEILPFFKPAENDLFIQRHYFLISPICLVALLSLLIFAKRWRWRTCFLAGLLFAAAVLPAVDYNRKNLSKRITRQKSEKRFYPFQTFQDVIPTDKPVANFFVSDEVHGRNRQLGTNEVRNKWMYELYFRKDLNSSTFAMGDSANCFDSKHDGAFLLDSDWELFNPTEQDRVLETYAFFPAPKHSLVYLARTGMADAHVYEYSRRNCRNANLGGNQSLMVASLVGDLPDTDSRAYFRFDLDHLIPQERTFEKVELTLCHYHAKDVDGTAINVHRVLQPWKEGNETFRSRQNLPDAPRETISWNHQPEWDEKTVWASQTLSSTDKPHTVVWDITALARKWQSGEYPNHGIVLVGESEGQTQYSHFFYSTENRSAWKDRPQIKVK